MNKIFRFLRLELLAVKPDLRLRNIIVVTVFMVVGYIVLGPSGIIMGLLPFTTSISTYAFSAGNDGLDELYVSLSISRRQIVFGRYAFILLVNICGVLVLLFIGLASSIVMGDETSFAGLSLLAIGFFLLCTFSDFLSAPILFKLGFKKARMFSSLLPMALFFAVLIIGHFMSGDITLDQEMVTTLLNDFGYELLNINTLIENIGSMLLMLASWFAVLVVSFLLSLKFYQTRDF